MIAILPLQFVQKGAFVTLYGKGTHRNPPLMAKAISRMGSFKNDNEGYLGTYLLVACYLRRERHLSAVYDHGLPAEGSLSLLSMACSGSGFYGLTNYVMSFTDKDYMLRRFELRHRPIDTSHSDD